MFDEIYALATEADRRKCAALVIDTLDDFLIDGKFSECNQFLEQVDLEKLKVVPTVLVNILAITACASIKLPARNALFSKTELLFKQEFGEERTRNILERYR